MMDISDSVVSQTPTGYAVSTNESTAHTYHLVSGIFHPKNRLIAELYARKDKCLVLLDYNVNALYGEEIKHHFVSHGINAFMRPLQITEDRKDIDMLLEVCEILADYEVLRCETVLVVGGGLVTDVVGFACAIYHRGTKYIRIPTTLVGMIDACVATKVAVNWKGAKNKLGAFYGPVSTIIDFTLLQTLPRCEVRNGVAEIIKVAACTQLAIFEMLEKHGQELIETRFGLVGSQGDPFGLVATTILTETIRGVLEAEMPNSREKILDRFMFFGHTWSPMLELTAAPILLHGHAVSIDMCYSASVALLLGLISSETRARFVTACSQLGLSLDHPAFTLELVQEATSRTITLRDGSLRAPMPTGDLGTYQIVSDVPWEILLRAHESHKRFVKGFPREGGGVEADVDARLRRKV